MICDNCGHGWKSYHPRELCPNCGKEPYNREKHLNLHGTELKNREDYTYLRSCVGEYKSKPVEAFCLLCGCNWECKECTPKEAK